MAIRRRRIFDRGKPVVKTGHLGVLFNFINKIKISEGKKGKEMKRVKKAIAVVSIMAFIFGGFITTASASPSQEPSADNEEVVASMPAANESEEAVTTGGRIANGCTVPTINYLNDGLTSLDVDYFNTKDEISANWDFITDESCPIIKYKYRVVKKQGATPWEAVTDWVVINDPSQKQVTADSLSGLITPLEEGEIYVVKVKAKNSAGWSDKYKSDGQILDFTPPTMNYFALQQNKPYGGGIHLEFSANDLNGIKSYQIYRNGLLYDTVSGITNTYVDAISGDIVEFTYYVTAVDVAGNVSEPSNLQSAVVDDVAPGAPSISYWIGGGNIVIFWPAVPGATNYELYRDGVLIKSGPEVKYTDTNLTKGQTYNYTVYAVDEAGNKSGPSNTLAIYVPKPRVSTVATTATGGEVQSATTTQGEQVSPSPLPSPSGEVKASESSQPEETAETKKTNWSLIIAIIIAAAIVIAGVLYWWYARGDEENEI